MIDLNYTMLIQWGISVALMIFLHFFLFKPVLKVIDARQAKIEGTFAGAEKLDQEADTLKEDYLAKMAAARERLAAAAAARRESAMKQARGLMEKTREEALAQVETTRERIQAESLEVKNQLGAQVETLARAIAGKILDRQI